MAKPTVNYPLGATLVMSGVTYEDAAAQCGAKNGSVLRVGLARKGVTARKARTLEAVGERNVSVTMRVASQASVTMREMLAKELTNTASALSQVPARANLKALRQRTDVLEPLARTAKIVHNWGDEQSNAMVFAGEFDSRQIIETPQAQLSAPIDIPPVVVSSESENVQSQSVVAATTPTTDN